MYLKYLKYVCTYVCRYLKLDQREVADDEVNAVGPVVHVA
jgi:hypothetical protein